MKTIVVNDGLRFEVPSKCAPEARVVAMLHDPDGGFGKTVGGGKPAKIFLAVGVLARGGQGDVEGVGGGIDGKNSRPPGTNRRADSRKNGARSPR